MTRTYLVAALLLCTAPVVVAAQAPADLVQAAHARDQAVDKVDVATWERLTAPEFTVVNETGHLLTRAERIAELRKAKPAPSPIPCGQERIAMLANGNAAVRRCLSGVWWTDVWVKSGTGWQVVAVQGTPAGK